MLSNLDVNIGGDSDKPLFFNELFEKQHDVLLFARNN